MLLLLKPDPRPKAHAERQGTPHQQGQRVETRKPYRFRFAEPQNLAEANRLFGAQFRQGHFKASRLRPIQRQSVSGGTTWSITIEGRFAPPGEQPYRDVMTFQSSEPVPDDATLISLGQAQVSNPTRYAWRIERTHSTSGMTTLTVMAERVITYLHHGSLDPSSHEHFLQPESDPRFFAASTYAPPQSLSGQQAPSGTAPPPTSGQPIPAGPTP